MSGREPEQTELLRDALALAYKFIDEVDAPADCPGMTLNILQAIRYALEETGGHIHPSEIELPF